MKTLAKANEERHQAYEEKGKSRPNGIECPECKSELWDTDPTFVLASCPPQLDVNCPDCGYTGYRVK